MAKLKLRLDDVQVETFSIMADEKGGGTIQAHSGGVLLDTCYATCTCQEAMCTADCTGLGVECYTANPAYYHCSAEPCTGAPACTRGTCLTYWPEDETC
jgi:hypothetical protein